MNRYEPSRNKKTNSFEVDSLPPPSIEVQNNLKKNKTK